MPLFRCENPECHAIDNSGCVDSYWSRKMARTQLQLHGDTGPWPEGAGTALILCSECDTGTWHDRFPKRRYDPDVDPPLLGDGPQLCTPRLADELDTARRAKDRLAQTDSTSPRKEITP